MLVVYQSIGGCYTTTGNYMDPIVNLNVPGIIAMKVGDLYAISVLNLNLGIAYAENNQLKEAGARLSDALSLAQQNGFTDVIQQIEKMKKDNKII